MILVREDDTCVCTPCHELNDERNPPQHRWIFAAIPDGTCEECGMKYLAGNLVDIEL